MRLVSWTDYGKRKFPNSFLETFHRLSTGAPPFEYVFACEMNSERAPTYLSNCEQHAKTQINETKLVGFDRPLRVRWEAES